MKQCCLQKYMQVICVAKKLFCNWQVPSDVGMGTQHKPRNHPGAVGAQLTKLIEGQQHSALHTTAAVHSSKYSSKTWYSGHIQA
jgi:hypothetical protein